MPQDYEYLRDRLLTTRPATYFECPTSRHHAAGNQKNPNRKRCGWCGAAVIPHKGYWASVPDPDWEHPFEERGPWTTWAECTLAGRHAEMAKLAQVRGEALGFIRI